MRWKHWQKWFWEQNNNTKLFGFDSDVCMCVYVSGVSLASLFCTGELMRVNFHWQLLLSSAAEWNFASKLVIASARRNLSDRLTDDGFKKIKSIQNFLCVGKAGSVAKGENRQKVTSFIISIAKPFLLIRYKFSKSFFFILRMQTLVWVRNFREGESFRSLGA